MVKSQTENKHVFQFVDILDKALYDRYVKTDATLERYIVYDNGKLDLPKTIESVFSHVDYLSIEEWINSIDFDFACEELHKVTNDIDENILEDNWVKAMKIQLIIADGFGIISNF